MAAIACLQNEAKLPRPNVWPRAIVAIEGTPSALDLRLGERRRDGADRFTGVMHSCSSRCSGDQN
jgi:hypothetical protein